MNEKEIQDTEEIKQRALRITEALYRTTDILFDKEPLKWSLRTDALDILEIVSNLNAHGKSAENGRLNMLIKNLFLKLELASYGTFISKINFDVLQREYFKIDKDISEFMNKHVLLDIPKYRTLKDNLSDSIEKDILPEKIPNFYQPQNDQKTENINNEIDEKKPSVDLLNRKSVIISALKERGPSSIGDLTVMFNGSIGEKTVQRELNALAEAGMIKKEGERRWRRYFI